MSAYGLVFEHINKLEKEIYKDRQWKKLMELAGLAKLLASGTSEKELEELFPDILKRGGHFAAKLYAELLDQGMESSEAARQVDKEFGYV